MLNQLLPSLLERAILFVAICLDMSAFVAYSIRPARVDLQSHERAIRYLRTSVWLAGLSIVSALCFASLYFLAH